MKACSSGLFFGKKLLQIWLIRKSPIFRFFLPREHVAKVYRNGQLVASLPYSWQNFRGIPPFRNVIPRGIKNPEWARVSKVILSPIITPDQIPHILDDLIKQLPKRFTTSLVLVHDPNVEMAFKRAGYKISKNEITHLRYPGPERADAAIRAEILKELPRQRRQAIRKARENYTVVEIDTTTFCRFYQDTLPWESGLSLKIAHDLIEEARRHGQVCVLAAERKDIPAQYDAATAYFIDKQRVYYCMGRHSNRSIGYPADLLLFEVMVDAQRRGLIFDADGAASENNKNRYEKMWHMKNIEQRDTVVHISPTYSLIMYIRRQLCQARAAVKYFKASLRQIVEQWYVKEDALPVTLTASL